MSAPGDWYRTIAEIPTINDHTLTIGAHYAAGERIITIDSHGLDVDEAPALIAAIGRAVEILALA